MKRIAAALIAMLAVPVVAEEPTAASARDRLTKACLLVVEGFPDLAHPEVVGVARQDRKVTVALRDSLGLRTFDCLFVSAEEPTPMAVALSMSDPSGAVTDTPADVVARANELIQAGF